MKGSAEIGFTILSMTVSLAAVFIPIVFMGGIVGRLLHEFAVTIILAILFSGIISVTLTPMLCARILQGRAWRTSTMPSIAGARTAFKRVQDAYDRIAALEHATTARSSWACSSPASLASVGLFEIMQEDFLPSDDTGRLTGQIAGRQRHLLRADGSLCQQVAEIVSADPNVAGVHGADGTAATAGRHQYGGLMIIMLKPLAASASSAADEIIRELAPKLQRIPGINVFVHQSAHHPHRRRAWLALHLSVHAAGPGPGRSCRMYSDQLMDAAEATRRASSDVNSDLDAAMPSVQVQIDRDRAAALGVSPQQIETALGDGLRRPADFPDQRLRPTSIR